MSDDPLRWLQLADSVQHLGLLSAAHIMGCRACAANPLGFRGVCAEGDKIWDNLDHAERELLAALPAMRAAGIDVSPYEHQLTHLRKEAGLDGEN